MVTALEELVEVVMAVVGPMGRNTVVIAMIIPSKWVD
jgi:hypothetical protein